MGWRSGGFDVQLFHDQTAPSSGLQRCAQDAPRFIDVRTTHEEK
jgi:hypothetical protein